MYKYKYYKKTKLPGISNSEFERQYNYFLYLLEMEALEDFYDLNSISGQWEVIKTIFGNIETIRNDINFKTESERLTYLSNIKNFHKKWKFYNYYWLFEKLEVIIKDKIITTKLVPEYIITKWRQDVLSVYFEIQEFKYQINLLYSTIIQTIQNNMYQDFDYESVTVNIGWKAEPKTFIKHINDLINSKYISIVDDFITFIHDDSYEDVIVLFLFWFDMKYIIPDKRENINLIPQKKIFEIFRYIKNNEVTRFSKSQIGVIKDKLTEDEIESRKENFRKILE